MDVDMNAQSKKGRRDSSRDRKITCNVCDKAGHIMKDCSILQEAKKKALSRQDEK
ncbi:unnamed protein product, partial [Umbelopsis sp. WA50703]